MKNANRFKGQWFQIIWKMIQNEKTGHISLLTDEQLKSLLEINKLTIPAHETLAAVADAIRYRLREFRRSLMPKLTSDEQYGQLRLDDLHVALNACFQPAYLTQAMSAVRAEYLGWLKMAYGGNPKNGLNNTSDVWSLRVRWFEPQVVDQFTKWTQEERLKDPDSKQIASATLSRIRALSKFIFENSSNPTRNRKVKHDLHSPEIEQALTEFGIDYNNPKNDRTVKTTVRKILKVAGVRSVDQLTKADIFERVFHTLKNGITSDEFSRAKPFFRWLGDKYKLQKPKFFENLKKNSIVTLTPEQNSHFDEEIGVVLLKSGKYREPSLDSPKGLYRFIVAATNMTDPADFQKLKPSDFILVAVFAAKSGYGLGYLKGIKALSSALVEFQQESKKWKFSNAQNWKEFADVTGALLKSCDGEPFNLINIAFLQPAFSEHGCNWKVFFTILKNQYYGLAAWEAKVSRKRIGPPRSKLVHQEYIKKVISYIYAEAYGPICGNQKKNAIKRADGEFRTGGLLTLRPEQWTTEKITELEYLLGFALQVGGGFRFRSETAHLKWFMDRPAVLTEDTPSCLYWQKIPRGLFWLGEKQKPKHSKAANGEDRVLVFSLNETRKNSLSYLGVFPTVCEDIIAFYLDMRKDRIKIGDDILPLSVTTLADHFKSVMCQLFGTMADDALILAGEKKNRALTTHSSRNMWESYVESNYRGSERQELQAVLLGHKMSRDAGSETSAIYADFIKTCELHIPTIRRIKDFETRTDDQIMHEETQKLVAILREESRAGHQITHEKIDSTVRAIAMLAREREPLALADVGNLKDVTPK